VASPSPAYRAARQGPSKPSKVRSTRTYHRKEGGTRKRSYQRLLPSEPERRHRSVPFPLLGLRNARRNPKGRQGALPLRMPRGFGTERLRTVSGSKGFPQPGTYRGSSEGIGREGRQWAFESPTVRSTRAYHRKGGGRRNGTKQYVLRGLFGTTGFVSGVYGMVLRRVGSGCVLRSPWSFRSVFSVSWLLRYSCFVGRWSVWPFVRVFRRSLLPRSGLRSQSNPSVLFSILRLLSFVPSRGSFPSLLRSGLRRCSWFRSCLLFDLLLRSGLEGLSRVCYGIRASSVFGIVRCLRSFFLPVWTTGFELRRLDYGI